MKQFNKQVLWLMVLGMVVMPLQADNDENKESLFLFDANTGSCEEYIPEQKNPSHLEGKDQSYFNIHDWIASHVLPKQNNQFSKQNDQPSSGKVGNYITSQDGIAQAFSITGSFINTVFMTGVAAYVYMYVNQNTKDFIGNQTMQTYYPGDIKTTLADVAGLTGAKAEMQDILSYFENPKAYQKMGAKVPKGVLMNGSPGNGKTLLAKAFAGEVNVPFISVGGSSFVQIYGGLGAARVRDLFKIAQQLSEQYGGCIIFIDEIDAVAQKRTSSTGSDREHDQTVAQLLESMDGLEKAESPIIVLGATNRSELLDPAIVRPGRFDRKVEIAKPFVKDRVALITLALENIKYNKNIDIESIARVTAGFSGAELTGLVNDAAILAVADKRKFVVTKDLELAFDHIVLGREISGMDQSHEARWNTAIHEAGHTVGWIFGNNQKYIVHKASITPRSHTLGVVWATPLEELYSSTEDEMRSRIVVALSGGLAEQAFGFDKSTGMSNDISKAFDTAYNMVARHGMSDDLHYIYDKKLPADISSSVYKEAKKIVDECLVVAKDLIASRKTEIEKIAKLLMEKGTVFGYELYELLDLPLPKSEVSSAV